MTQGDPWGGFDAGTATADPWAGFEGKAEPSPASRFSIPDIGAEAAIDKSGRFPPIMQSQTGATGGPTGPEPAIPPPSGQGLGGAALSGLEDVVRGAELGTGRMVKFGGQMLQRGSTALQDAFGSEKTRAEKKREVGRAGKLGDAITAQGLTHPAPTSLPGEILQGAGGIAPILAGSAINPALGAAALGAQMGSGVEDAYDATLKATGNEALATERAVAEVPLQALYLAPLGRILMGAGPEGATLIRKGLDGLISGALGPGAARVLGEVASEKIDKQGQADLGEALKRGAAAGGHDALVNAPLFAFLSAMSGEKAPDVAKPEQSRTSENIGGLTGESPPPEAAPPVTLGQPAKEPLGTGVEAPAESKLPLPSEPPSSPAEEARASNPSQRGAADLFGPRKPNAPRPDELGFYSPIEKALTEKMPEKAGAEQVRNIAKQAQPREYEWSGLEDFLKGKLSVTRDEVRKFLRENSVKVEEEPLTQAEVDQYAKWQLPGGENARGLKLTMPSGGSSTEINAAREAHREAVRATNALRVETAKPIFEKYQPQIDAAHAKYLDTSLSATERVGAAAERDYLERKRDSESAQAERAAISGGELGRTERQAFERLQAEEDRARAGRFTGGHMGGETPNILAHVRFNDRVDAQGRKTLFLEEIQSDWAAKGEREGFGKVPLYEAWRDGKDTGYGLFTKAEAEARGLTPAGGYELRQSAENSKIHGVPDMPFKTREQYAKLALRRMIRYAAEKGYDSVSWTTGEQQAERYDLSKQISKIKLTRTSGGIATPEPGPFDEGMLTAYDHSGREVVSQYIRDPKEVADYVGKEAAEKLLSGPGRKGGSQDSSTGSRVREISGLDLKVGGEGMRSFYDKTLPKVANEIGKKWGAKAETTEVGTEEGWEGVHGEEIPPATTVLGRQRGYLKEVHTLELPDSMRSDVMEKGQPRLGRLDLFGSRNPRPAVTEGGGFDTADETTRDRIYSGLVNDLERIVKLEKAAPNKIQGEPLEQSLSLMPGRKYGEAEKLKAQTIEPLKAMLKDAKIPPIESKGGSVSASDYLYAVHATEAPDSAKMGMTPLEAEKIRGKAESGPNADAYAKIREWNRALNVKRLDTLEKGGLISAETRKAWEEKYGADYVPLRTAQDPFEQYVGQGRGLSVRGKESKAREGRSSKADSPLVFALETMDTALDRSESNRIGQKLGELVEKNPEGPWKIETDQNKRRQGEEWLPFKVDGEQRFIVTQDKGLAEAFKRLQVPDPGLLKVLDPLLKYWHKVIIQYNPVFPLTNVPRDMGVAAIRHAIHGDLPAAMGTLKNGLPAAKGAFQAMREEGAGGKWGDVYRKARDAGALIGWKDVHDYGERVKDFEKAVSRTSKAKAFGDLIDDLNSSTELGTRLATFDALLKSGHDESEAAMATRRITADFARRGRWGPTYRRLYMFSGANVQGTSEMLASIGKNPGRATTVIGALIGAGFANYALSKTYGDDAELDKLSEGDKARFFGVMLGKRRYGFAAPYGFNLFPYLGWKIGEAVLGGQDPKKMLGGVASTALDSFSPLPQGASVTQSLTPTVARPFEEIAENKKFSGAPIAPDQSPFDRVKKPNSQRYFPNVSGASKEVAETLNRVTGGNQLEGGLVDISPEWIDHLAAAASGGLGTFASRTLNVAKDVITGQTSDLKLTDIPLVRPFAQEASRGAGTRVYKENVQEMELAKAQAKAGLPVTNPSLIGLDSLARSTDKNVSLLYKAMDAGDPKDRARYQEAIDALHDQFNAAAKAVKKR